MENRGRLRKHELAGWRTRSLLPTHHIPNRQFSPVIKLRGLPYYCTLRHVVDWFGPLSKNLDRVIILNEFDNENSGFALAIMKSSEAAVEAWETLHKKCITSKRFVEVFCMLPPNCPLMKRVRATGGNDDSNNGGGKRPSVDAITSKLRNAVKVAEQDLHCSTNLRPHANDACVFCSHMYSAHSDHGLSSVVTTVSLHTENPYMHLSYLEVPALIYTDTSYGSDIESFKPNLFQTTDEYLKAFPERKHRTVKAHTEEYFHLANLEGYSMHNLVMEIIDTIEECGPMTLSQLGNHISILGRAFLFVTENKLQLICERFVNFLTMESHSFGITVSIKPGITKEKIMRERLNSFKSHRTPKRKAPRPAGCTYLPVIPMVTKPIACINDESLTRSSTSPTSELSSHKTIETASEYSMNDLSKHLDKIIDELLYHDDPVSWGI